VAFLTCFQAYRRLSGSVLSLTTMPQDSKKRDLLTNLQNLSEFINVNKSSQLNFSTTRQLKKSETICAHGIRKLRFKSIVLNFFSHLVDDTFEEIYLYLFIYLMSIFMIFKTELHSSDWMTVQNSSFTYV
jgi:hypothetical protein